jgi:hypothetical protein
MDKTVAGVLGAITAVVAQAHAAPAPSPPLEAAMQASSYADLLRPIPNALALLAAAPEPAVTVQPVQYHHHHHHHHRRRRYHHHHHHHHYGY